MENGKCSDLADILPLAPLSIRAYLRSGRIRGQGYPYPPSKSYRKRNLLIYNEAEGKKDLTRVNIHGKKQSIICYIKSDFQQ